MFKKIVCLIIIANIVIANMFIVNAEKNTNTPVLEPQLNSRIAVAYDRTSGTVIWGKNENKRSSMASTTKIMTAIIALENTDLSQMITISQKAAGTGGSRLGLKKDDKITMQDLIYGLMLKSGNDASVAIAETVGGSVEQFAELMNNKAKELKLKDTHFVTPHGLDDPEHYTTAVELAKLADYALKNEMFAKIVNTQNYTITINGYSKNISNTNELLGNLEGVNGVKTGFTNNAGRCLVTSVKRNNFEIITVVLQADTKKIRTSDSIKLINYVYDNYELVDIKKIIDDKFSKWREINEKRIIINKSKNNKINLYITNLQNNIIPIKKTEKDSVDIEINNLFYFEAPIEQDSIIGNLKVNLKDKTIDVIEIKNSNCVKKKDVIDYLKIFAQVLR